MSDNNSPFKPLRSEFKSVASKEKTTTRPASKMPAPVRGGSTMNRPGSVALNSNATATAAAQAFAREQETNKDFAPAISKGTTPPVIEDNPVFVPAKEESKEPSIGKFDPLTVANLTEPDFPFDPEKVKAKSIQSRQVASELKLTPFDESQVQSFGDGAHKPTLQERIEANNKGELVFTPIAEKDALGGLDSIKHKPSLQERISQSEGHGLAFAPVANVEETSQEPSPFKPLKQKPAFVKPTYNKSSSSNNDEPKSPFAPRRSDD